MVKQQELLAEKRTTLAEKRTELAHERTVMAYVRTAFTVILFGAAFFGLSETKGDFLFVAGWIATGAGILLALIAVIRGLKHSKEIQKIKEFFEKVIDFRFEK